ATFEAAESDDEKLAVLAAAGVGGFPKNENLYGYPNEPHFVVYEEPSIPATISLEGDWLGGVHRRESAHLDFAGQRITRSILATDVDFDRERTDLAPLASAEFSSEEQASTVGVADRKLGGYPGE